MKKMTATEFAVHLGVWLLATLPVAAVWGISDSVGRTLIAPEVSAAVNGLAGIAWGVFVLFDLHKNRTRFEDYVLESRVARWLLRR